jgi:hypothetical protein
LTGVEALIRAFADDFVSGRGKVTLDDILELRESATCGVLPPITIAHRNDVCTRCRPQGADIDLGLVRSHLSLSQPERTVALSSNQHRVSSTTPCDCRWKDGTNLQRSTLRPLLTQSAPKGSPTPAILRATITSLSTSLSTLRSDHFSLLSSHLRLKSAHEANLSSRRRAIAQLHSAQSSAETLRGELAEARGENERLRFALAGAAEEVEALREEKRELVKDLTAVGGRHEELRGAIRELLEENGRLKEDMADIHWDVQEGKIGSGSSSNKSPRRGGEDAVC